MIGARWRLPLRIAWRTARRYPGRTVLVGALVGVPVFAATFVDTLARTASTRPATNASHDFGTADGVVVVTDRVRYEPYGSADGTLPAQRDPATVKLPALLPAGTRLVDHPGRRSVRFAHGDRTVLADGAELHTDDPITTGMTKLRSGTLPARPGEVALSPTLASRLGVRPGDEVRLRQRPGALRVVGLADSGCRGCQQAYGLPGWIGAGSADPPQRFSYLIDLPGDAVADRAFADRLAGLGVEVRSRDRVLHPERWGEQRLSGTADLLSIAVLIVGLGLIEVVLLAGTAFAVTARRRVREFALVLATGGRPADARRLVLTHGVVLGLIGSAGAALLAVGAVFAGLPFWQNLANRDFDGLAVGPRDLAVLIGVGVLTSVLAAALPARSAGRVPVLAALAGRYGRPSRERGRRTIIGAAVAMLAGLAVAVVAARGWHAAAVTAAQRQTVPDTVPYALAMTVGFGLAIAGLALAAPALVGLVGRVAGRLPLSGRLAVRDAARHRHRTGPAVAAAMVAVTGSVAVLFAVASYDRHDRAQYRPAAPIGAVSMYTTGNTSEADLLAGAQAAAAELPGGRVLPVRWSSVGPAGDQLSIDVGDQPRGPGCSPVNAAAVGAGTDLAVVLAGPRADAVRAALASGKAVAFSNCVLDHGQLRLFRGADRWRSVPAVQFADDLPYDGLPSVVLPDSLIAQAKIRTTVSFVLITTSRPPTGAEEDRARGVLNDGVNLTVERGYGAPYRLGILILVGVAGLITLAGVLISVALSAAEGQADLATLAAIGAAPRRRRALAAWQAGLIGGLGALPGLLLGAAVGRIVVLTQTGYPLVLPWPALLAIGLGVPALGVLVAGGATRPRLPMVRRLA